MVAPWKHFSIRAALWNQGEANANEKIAGVDQTEYYADMYQRMIADWRDKKGMGDFAWLTQGLPPSVPTNTSREEQMKTGRMEIRLAQAEAATHSGSLTDISGTGVAIDLGGSSVMKIDHPPNKNEMSRRLALQAVHVAYAKQGRLKSLLNTKSTTTWTGPELEAVARSSDALLLTFRNYSASGMSLRDVKAKNIDGTSNDCTLCCAESPPFEVTADGETWELVTRQDTVINGDVVELRSSAAAKAQAVRYAFLDYVECVLQNDDGLPAGPFLRNLTKSMWILQLRFQSLLVQ
jgi:hypothetical protein